jgi:SOS-response transcriptional repressor LexA
VSSIGERLREARREAGYDTPTAAARAHGWNKFTYRSAENGHKPPGRDAAIKYARALNVSIDWVLTGRPPKRGTHVELKNATLQLGTIAAQAQQWVEYARKTGHFPVAEMPMATMTVQTGVQAPLLPDAPTVEMPAGDDSMIYPSSSSQSVYPGDVLLIDLTQPLAPGNMVVAKDGRRNVVRRVRTITEEREGKSDHVVLGPANPDYAEMVVAADKVVGTVVGIYRPVTKVPPSPH